MDLLQGTLEEKVLAGMANADEIQGALILLKALSVPVMQVATNAGIEGAVVLSKIQAITREKGVSFFLFPEGSYMIVHNTHNKQTLTYTHFICNFLFSVFVFLARIWMGCRKDGIL